MSNIATIPNIIWRTSSLSTVHTNLGPKISFLGINWRLKPTLISEIKNEKLQLTLERLSLPLKLQDITFSVETCIDVKGTRALPITTTHSLEAKVWHIWADYIKKIYSLNIKPDDSVIFWISIKPVSLMSILSHKDNKKEELSDCVLNLSSDFEKLFGNEEHSDVVLKCGDQSFPAHKAILSARSEYFAAMFRNKMKESEEHVVEIKNADPSIVKELICYLYTGKIRNLPMESLIKLYAIADMYVVEALKIKCTKLVVNTYRMDVEDKSMETGITEPDTQPEGADIQMEEASLEGILFEETDAKDKQLLKDLFRTREWDTLSLENPKLAHVLCKSLLFNRDI